MTITRISEPEPVVAGSLRRVVGGALTDRFGGRVTVPLISAAIVPVLRIGVALGLPAATSAPAVTIVRLTASHEATRGGGAA
ncbi:hypothetical protein [Nonomuraea basaltis]|uniref:hypothetical protein n=1 Tax=Nonomuraea basaltis TaxID=2495887 RepID=UPI00197E5752|nr:hypothetical protein [Nonomuraea basaltis]